MPLHRLAAIAAAALCLSPLAAVAADAPGCLLVDQGYGPEGRTRIRVERVASGLEVPWGLAFLPGGDVLVTERPGRLRLIRGGQLLGTPGWPRCGRRGAARAACSGSRSILGSRRTDASTSTTRARRVDGT